MAGSIRMLRSLKQLAAHGFLHPDGRNWRIRPVFVFNGNGNGAAQREAVRNTPAGTPDPYAGGRTDLTVIEGGGEEPDDGRGDAPRGRPIESPRHEHTLTPRAWGA
ncbi:hypothetical protein ACIRFH_02110 [Streptomyces sp. NPDC093586]|uniref:hypothetical protein n=1 Tax=Streptomyces sp. NPDC093586 TaxID=3366042 RepID=UPI00380E9183